MQGDNEDEIFSSIIMDYNFLNGNPETLSGEDKYQLLRHKLNIPFSINYGYAITVWKAQGSQWENIVLFEEGWPRDRKLHRQYLYTGITRAEKKLVVII